MLVFFSIFFSFFFFLGGGGGFRWLCYGHIYDVTTLSASCKAVMRFTTLVQDDRQFFAIFNFNDLS